MRGGGSVFILAWGLLVVVPVHEEAPGATPNSVGHQTLGRDEGLPTPIWMSRRQRGGASAAADIIPSAWQQLVIIIN